MKIHEYHARNLFRQYGIPVPNDILCLTPEEAKNATKKINKTVVIKAQVLVGGRGKAGGVKLAHTPEEAHEVAKSIIGMEIKGCKVEKILVSEAVDIKKEFYVGMINDRNTKSVTLMVSSEGGVEIEQIAKENPAKITKFNINPITGLLSYQARNIALSLFPDIKTAQKAAAIITRLYKLFSEKDATIAEINPLVLTQSEDVFAIDGKINFDDNALFRQPDILAMREPDSDELIEIEANYKGLSYIRLDGTIGCMVNGAGLAMATMDMIKLYGGNPANFLDIGGSSNPQKVIDAMDILLRDQNVKAVMINIFGGITRCDDVAKGLIEAMKTIKTKVPIVVRLAGTNAEEGLALLKPTNLCTVSSMSEAAKKAIELSKKNNLH